MRPFAKKNPVWYIDRRGFLASVAATLPLSLASHDTLSPHFNIRARPPLDDDLLLALGQATLPNELGASGVGVSRAGAD